MHQKPWLARLWFFIISLHIGVLLAGFTPMLKDFYDEAEDIEIVFVSSDRSPDEMMSYLKNDHGEWYAVEHNSAVANNLKQKYGISGIPSLIVCKHDGTLVTKDGRSNVTSKAPAQAV